MTKQYATFYLGENLLGVNVLLIREINRHLEITPVELVPSYVYGLINLRGQIVTVLDLRERIGFEVSDDQEKIEGIIILKTSAEMAHLRNLLGQNENTARDMVGFLVDKIGDMVSIDDKNIETPPANVSGVEGKYIDGVVKLEKDLLIILKVSEILKLEN